MDDIFTFAEAQATVSTVPPDCDGRWEVGRECAARC